jgi:hypothetical protein
MTSTNRGRADTERGQALAVMVFAMIAAIAMLGLIIDGGNAWAQQRMSQNGSDAASEAGATALGRRIANTDPALDSHYWDGQVANAIAVNASQNGITVPLAYYTDICGVGLTPSGARAAADFSDAAVVGAGLLPAGSGPPPDPCPSTDGSVGPVAGVKAFGDRTFNTFFARILCANNPYQCVATTEATAVTGYLQQTCTGNLGGNCILLPIATYSNIVTCDGSGKAVDSGVAYTSLLNQDVMLPICKNASGSTGWLDWSTGNGGVGGLDGLRNCVQRAASSDPCLPTIQTPTWWEIAQSGGTSSGPLEDDLNFYAGEIVLLPIFNLMCAATPYQPDAGNPPDYGCQPSEKCTIQNQANPGDPGCQPEWYHLQPFAPFWLKHVYTHGNSEPECNNAASNPDPANRTQNCIVGQFVDYSIGGQGTVGGSANGSGVIGIQLIR